MSKNYIVIILLLVSLLPGLPAMAQTAATATGPFPTAPASPGQVNPADAGLAVNQPPPLPMLDTVFNGRPQQIQVESLSNPMVIIETTRGNMLLELFPAEAPATVANFIALAEGSKAWIDPLTGQTRVQPFYDGLLIHKVMKGFMIQGGSITGDDTGYPGYFIPDEINASSLDLDRMQVLDVNGEPNPVLGVRSQTDFQEQVLKPLYQSMGIDSQAKLETRVLQVDQRLRSMTVKQLYELHGYRYRDDLVSRAPVQGVIAMANSGPDTNGSQFFITLADTPWLLGRHTVFGKIRAGLNVLESIITTPVDANFRPQAEISILAIHSLAPATNQNP